MYVLQMQIYQDMFCHFEVYTNAVHAKEVADSQTLPSSEPDIIDMFWAVRTQHKHNKQITTQLRNIDP